MSLFVPNWEDPEAIREFLKETLTLLRSKPGSTAVDANIDAVHRMLTRLDEIDDTQKIFAILAEQGLEGILVSNQEKENPPRRPLGFITPQDDSTGNKTKRHHKGKMGFGPTE